MPDMVSDKFQHATYLDSSSFIFLNYKNTVTCKTLIGTSPHASRLLFSDVFPGSISGSA